jgi:hypothetical protein
MSDMSRDPDTADVDRVVDAIMDCTAPITQMLDHMARAPGAPDVEHAVRTLRRLLAETLERPLGEHDPAALAATVEVLGRVTDVMVEEIYLMPHGGPRRPNRAERRRRRPH